MTKTRENRMETLKAANIGTGKYFSVALPEGLKPGSTINITISEDGTPIVVDPVEQKTKELTPDEADFVNEIFNDGYVRNTRLHRRWVMAQMFRMLNYRSSITGKSGYDAYLNERYDYMYQFEMMLEEIRVLGKLYHRDTEAFYERSLFFTPEVIVYTCEDYMQKLRKYVDRLKIRKCKGIPYKRIFGQNIFLDDINRKIFEPQMRNLLRVKDAAESTAHRYNNLYWSLRHFCNQMYKLPYDTPKCKEWKDAFKGEGSYYTLMNLIKFHKCNICIDENDSVKWLSLRNSIEYVIDAAKQYKGEYYRLFAILKKVIKDNEFDFEARMNKVYTTK